MASDMSKNKYYKTRSGGKTQMKNGGGSPKFKAAAATALLYSSSTAATRATPWWRRSTSATRPDPPTRCYIKTCQLQRRFISHSIDSSLPYFNRPIVHQERSDSLVYFFANKIAPPSIIYIQRGLTKFLWFFNYFLDWKGINSSGDMTEKEVSIFSVFWRKLFLFYFTWGQWRHLVRDKSIGTFFFSIWKRILIPVFSFKRCCCFQIKSRYRFIYQIYHRDFFF